MTRSWLAGRQQRERQAIALAQQQTVDAAVGCAHLRRQLDRAGEAFGEAQPAFAASRWRLQKQLLLVGEQRLVAAIERNTRRRQTRPVPPEARHRPSHSSTMVLSATVGSYYHSLKWNFRVLAAFWQIAPLSGPTVRHPAARLNRRELDRSAAPRPARRTGDACVCATPPGRPLPPGGRPVARPSAGRRRQRFRRRRGGERAADRRAAGARPAGPSGAPRRQGIRRLSPGRRTDSPSTSGIARQQSLAADLARRDFTVNAIALDIARPAGHRSIRRSRRPRARRRLRATTPSVFADDPLRVLRLVRLSLQLPGFSSRHGDPRAGRAAAADSPEWQWNGCATSSARCCAQGVPGRLRAAGRARASIPDCCWAGPARRRYGAAARRLLRRLEPAIALPGQPWPTCPTAAASRRGHGWRR